MAKRKSKPKKAYWKMTTEELGEATAEFDEEFVEDTFGKPTPKQKAQLARAKRKPGRPKVGKGAKVISLSVEVGLLEKTDRLAKKQGCSRAALVARGLEAIVGNEISLR